MKKDPFVHLHFHTEYSLLDGACQIDRVMKRATELGMSKIAITDHGVLYGVVDFYLKAHEAGIKPLLGCEVYVAPGSRHDRKSPEAKAHAYHLVLLAETNAGYQNLMRLVSLAHLEGFYYKPRVDKELLAQHHGGLIALSSCLKGEVTTCCKEGRLDDAARVAGEYSAIFGPDNFFLELQDHGITDQRTANRHLLELARRMRLPLVATNDVHYLKQEHAEAHDVMLCMQTQTVISDPTRMRYRSDQFFLKSGAEMAALFGEVPEALHHTERIGERCNVELELGGKRLHFPTYQVPPGQTHKEFLLARAREGLTRRYGIRDPDHPADARETEIVQRFRYELSIIEATKFVNYFLVVWDFIHFAKSQGIAVGPGRGSGAGSMIAYLLGITDIDPLRYGLIFERFLNPDRVSPPDFDIDFCQTRRGEVIEYVKRKYGRENVAQIITFGTLGAKTVIRDIGRVLEIPLAECDRLAKMVPEDPKMTLDLALKQNPEFRKATETEPHARRILPYALVLEGLPRQPSTHAAGVVIGERPLIELIPLARDKEQEIISQLEMGALEQVGLLKMDFLGLKTLTVIQEALAHIRNTRGLELDILSIPTNDPATYELLNRGDTVGVFQVESQGMREVLRRIGLSCIEELLAMIALYRPGPMQFIDDFVNGKHGRRPITYDHPLLEPILKETYGIFVYQEQVQQAANVLAGFSMGQGDILRRAIGKKKEADMAQQRTLFIAGCSKVNHIPKEKGAEIFDKIKRFAQYGFNKSHSAAYGLVTFQTAYLKAHYPVEFMAALLSSEIGNTDKLPVLIAEAQEMGIEVLPPNINDSDLRFKPAGQAIRFGLAGIKNVGTAAVECLVRERTAHGPFKDLLDFCARVDSQTVNRKTLESLIKCGALDFTGMSRGRLFNGLDFAISRAAGIQQDRKTGQASLFEQLAAGPQTAAHDELPPADPWPEHQMLAAERELLGFYISGHPLTAHEWILKQYSVPAGPLDQAASGTRARIGGLVAHLQKKFTKKNQEPMGVFRLEQLEGAVDVVVFPEPYREFGVHLRDEAPVMVCGELTREETGFRMRAAEIYPLADIPRHFTQWISLHVPVAGLDDQRLERIKELLLAHPGEVAVSLCLQYPTGEKVFIRAARRFKVMPVPALLHELEHELGEDGVYLAVNPKPCKRAGTGRSRNGWHPRKES